ncbi:MAG TPA: VOC family protein [Rhizomicrobium sp.]|jgi:catechol 2,3-dioxygenase-like lactoylglutathione lyase family enzyme
MVARAIIDHTGIGVSDVVKLGVFYDAILGALGLKRVVEMPDNGGIAYGMDFPSFWIDKFHRHDAKQHTAFAAQSRAEVDAFHAAGLRAGGKDNGAPGSRPTEKGYPPGYYAAFIIDPDGNNMEAVFREPQ